MFKQIWMLTKVSLQGMFGINEVKHTRDSKKKRRFGGMIVVWLLLLLMMIGYVVLLSNIFTSVGLESVVPMYLFAVCSIVILVFSFFKASAVLFQARTFEMLTSMPVSNMAIVASRYLTMYISNLGLSLIVMIPGFAVCASALKPGALFYVFGVIGVLVLPMIPITIATAIGALITAISAKMKHKNIVTTVLMVLFVLVILAGELGLTGSSGGIDEQAVLNVVAMITDSVKAIYAPAMLFNNAVTAGSVIDLLILVIVSVVPILVVIAAISKPFGKICSALNSSSAKNDYKMTELTENSVMKALVMREMKRYFSVSVYVYNTIIGEILMVALSVAALVMGPEKIEASMNMPGITSVFFPLALAIIITLMPTSACALSMEGKQFWVSKSLPISDFAILKAKIYWNLLLAAPFFAVSVIIGIIAIKPTLVDALLIVLVPGIYIVFTSICGLFINVKFPVFNWTEPARVVKQSASSFMVMFMDMILAGVPIILIIVLGTGLKNVIMGVVLALLVVLSIVLWNVLKRVKLINME